MTSGYAFQPIKSDCGNGATELMLFKIVVWNKGNWHEVIQSQNVSIKWHQKTKTLSLYRFKVTSHHWRVQTINKSDLIFLTSTYKTVTDYVVLRDNSGSTSCWLNAWRFWSSQMFNHEVTWSTAISVRTTCFPFLKSHSWLSFSLNLKPLTILIPSLAKLITSVGVSITLKWQQLTPLRSINMASG